MVQKSGEKTSWGKGSWNPIIYKYLQGFSTNPRILPSIVSHVSLLTYHIWYSFASYVCFPNDFDFDKKISPLPSHRKMFRARQWTLIPITSTLQPGNWIANLSIWEVPKVSVYYMVNPMIFLVVEDRSCWWFVRFRDHDGKRKRPNCWCFLMFVIFTPILEKKRSNLTHIFQMVWFNHHLELVGVLFIGAINWFPVGRTNARAWVVEILPTKVPVDGLYKFCSSACVTTPKKNGKKNIIPTPTEKKTCLSQA